MRFPATTARNPRAHFIGGVGIESLLDSSSRQVQHLLADRDFQGLQVQMFHRLAPQQRLNLRNDVQGQQIGEEVFFKPCS
jgi:hypothetical protein